MGLLNMSIRRLSGEFFWVSTRLVIVNMVLMPRSRFFSSPGVLNITDLLPYSRFVRLSSILAKRNLAPTKLDEIKVKINILKSFVEDRAKDTIAREESEL